MRRERETDSGLHVVETITEALEEAVTGKRPPQQITMCKGRATLASGSEVISEVNLAGPKSKLDPDERKSRREDNRWVKARHRKFRRRKAHGRP